MFNNTSKIVGHVSYQSVGVLLPHSTKIISSNDIDKKIIKTKKHIEYLSSQLPFNNRGGKAVRTKKVSVLQQISLSTSRLKLLEKAKAIVLNPPKITNTSALVERKQPSMAETAAKVAAFAGKYFAEISKAANSSNPINVEPSEFFKRRKFTVLS